MSKDIDQALIDIIAAQKSLSPEEAANFVADLEENDRYLKDVY
jgi:sulfite reductase alpha subunit-like flavoprotein